MKAFDRPHLEHLGGIGLTCAHMGRKMDVERTRRIVGEWKASGLSMRALAKRERVRPLCGRVPPRFWVGDAVGSCEAASRG